MIAIHPIKIAGRWQFGVALDYHTTSSTPIGYNEAGHMLFNTVRPEIAELLYQLKYQNNQQAAPKIIEAAAAFLCPHREKLDLIIPVPASTVRIVQPVMLLATGIGKALALPVVCCVTTTHPTSQLKGITDPKQRQKLVKGLYEVDSTHTENKNILLFDDLFRSGTTMNAITDILLNNGRAKTVRAMTITKTRSNQ